MRAARSLLLLHRSASALANPVTDGLVAEYRFDEGSGYQLTDYSGVGNHLQVGSTGGADANTPTWIAGGGLSFAANNYCCQATPADILGGDAYGLSLVIVAQPDAEDAGLVCFSGGSLGLCDTYFGAPTPRNILTIGAGTYKTFATTIDTGSYHYYEVTLPAWSTAQIPNAAMWRDRVSQAAAANATSAVDDRSGGLRLGHAAAKYLTGKMQYVAIYSRAAGGVLSSAEKTSIYTDWVKPLMALRSISI